MRLPLVALLVAICSSAASLPKLKVSENRRFLVTADGKPFFYLADTAWELFHRLNRQQAIEYLDTRAKQHFNAVQAVALAELDGVTDPNAYGDLPITDKDPLKPVEKYWKHVDYVVDQANARGIYISMLPSWGRWVNHAEGKKDESLLTAQNGQAYGEFLGRRYGKKGIIWVLGGDRTAEGFEATWRAIARGIAIGVSGKEDYDAVLMTFHPRGGGTSSTSFHNDTWLDINMHQTGHGLAQDVQPWARVTQDYERTPIKPVIDGEPLYEDHPLAFRAKENGYSFDAHVRQRAYWDVFSGTCGHTYGNHSVWQMYMPGRQPVNGPLLYWNEAIHRPGASQMQYLKALLESHDYLSRVPDQSLIKDALTGPERIAATRGSGYALVYSPQGRKFSVNMDRAGKGMLKVSWFNPRNGAFQAIGEMDAHGSREFTCPSEGFGSDWVLVLEEHKI